MRSCEWNHAKSVTKLQFVPAWHMTIALLTVCRAPAGDAAEGRPGHEPRAPGVVVVEETADHLTGGEEAGDRSVLRVEHLGVGVDAEAAERKRDAAGDGVPLKRRLVDRDGPVRLRRGDALGVLPVEDRRVEVARLNGGVERVDRPPEARRVDH